MPSHAESPLGSWCANGRAALAVAQLRLARGGGRPRGHLTRMALATVIAVPALVWVHISVTGSGPNGSPLVGSPLVGSPLVGAGALYFGYALLSWSVPLAALLSLDAAGLLAGPERLRSVEMATLTRLGGRWFGTGWLRIDWQMIASWLGQVVVVLVRCLALAPALAVLTLADLFDVESVARTAFAVLLTVGVASAFGLATSPLASSRDEGIVVAAALLLSCLALPMAAADLGLHGVQRWIESAWGWSPTAILRPGAPVLTPVLLCVVLTVVFLLVAGVGVRHRIAATHGVGTPAADGTRPQGRERTPRSSPRLAGLDQRRALHSLRCCGAVLIGGLAVVVVPAWLTHGSRFIDRLGAAPDLIGTLLGTLAAFGLGCGGSHVWSLLESRGLAPLLLSSPLPAATFARAGVRTGLLFAGAPLLLCLPYLGAMIAAHDLTPWAAAMRLTSVVAALSLVLAAGLIDGTGVAHGSARRRFSTVATVCLGPIAMQLLVCAAEGRLWRTASIGWWLVPLGMALLPLTFGVVRLGREPRMIRCVAATWVGLTVPGLIGIAVPYVVPAFLFSPLSLLFVGFVDSDAPAGIPVVVAAQLLAAIGMAWCAVTRFDAITGRAG